MSYDLVDAKPIHELCKIIDCEHKTAPYVDESEFLVVRTSNVRNGQLVMEDMKFTTMEGFEEWTQRAIPENGDVLFTREAPAGESCLVPRDKKICMGQRMVLLRPNRKKVDPLFLSLILATEKCKFDIYRLSIGSTVSRINISDIRNLKVASPPLLEQQKIAQILSSWDKAISTTEKLLENSQQQKKALMQQLLTGKKRLLDENGVRFSDKWSQKLVEEYFDVRSSKRVLQADWKSKGVPFYRTRELVSLSKRQAFRSEIFISDELFLELSQKYGIPSAGDFLVSGVGTLGISYQVKDGDKFYFKDGNVLWFKLKNHIYSDYFKYCFQSDFVQEQIEAQASVTTVGTYTIQNAKKTKFWCPPSLQEQQKIAAVLRIVDQEIETLQKKLDCLSQEKKTLMQQLLTGKKRVKVAV